MISQTTDMIPSDVTLSAWETNRGVLYYRATKILQSPIKNKTERCLKITIQIFHILNSTNFLPFTGLSRWL